MEKIHCFRLHLNEEYLQSKKRKIVALMVHPDQTSPKVFISYSHDSDGHKKWVENLACKLRDNGIDVKLDIWDLHPGEDINLFMEKGIRDSERVIMICTETYVTKANKRERGVGYEAMIVTGQLLKDLGSPKFIPIIRQTSAPIGLPTFAETLLYLNLSEGQDTEDQFHLLLHELHEVPNKDKPPLGRSPFNKFTQTTDLKDIAVFSYQFGQAFPGLRGIQWFSEHDAVKRLEKLFEGTCRYQDPSRSEPIWWWRDGNCGINEFRVLKSPVILLDIMELKIKRMAAVYSRSYYRQFVYLEADPMPSTEVYGQNEEHFQERMNVLGYVKEEYGLYKNKYFLTREEYDDDAALINGELVTLGEDVELRKRFLSPYNLIISAQFSSINNQRFDLELETIMNEMLKSNFTIEQLSKRVEELPKPSWPN